MTGDNYKRTFVDGLAQCGCEWVKAPEGDRLVECPIHRAATFASVEKFDRERSTTTTCLDTEYERYTEYERLRQAADDRYVAKIRRLNRWLNRWGEVGFVVAFAMIAFTVYMVSR